ncbi:MAG: transposase [Ktedonobacteraceae bacterium]
MFSSRKIERATYEAVPFRFIAGNQHPDHDTLATFRRTFLPELKDLFVQVLLLAQEAGVLKLGTLSLDGTKVHADASRHNAVSYKRLLEMETQLRAESEELFRLSEQSDQPEIPDGLVVREEMARREDRLARLASRRSMRPNWRSARSGSARRGDAQGVVHRCRRCQDSVMATSTTSPTRSRASCANPTDAGFEHDDNVQLAVDQKSLLIVASALSNHPNDRKARRTHTRGHRARDRHTRGGGAGCWLLWPRDAGRLCET